MRGLEPRDYELSMKLGAVENLKAGNTTVCEVFFSPHYDEAVDQVAARALDDTGIRSVLFRCTNDESFFDGFVEARGDIVRRVAELHDRWPNAGRTRVGAGPLIPWGSSAGSFGDLVERQRTRVRSWSSHLTPGQEQEAQPLRSRSIRLWSARTRETRARGRFRASMAFAARTRIDFRSSLKSMA